MILKSDLSHKNDGYTYLMGNTLGEQVISNVGLPNGPIFQPSFQRHSADRLT